MTTRMTGSRVVVTSAGRAVVVLALSVATLHLVSAAEQSTSGQDAPIQTVGSLNELRAVTPAEKARAERFNFSHLPPLIESKALHMGSGLAILPDPPVDGRPDPDAEERQLVCRSDGIAYGSVQRSRVLLNKDETFLFTDYVVQVTQWVKPERGPSEILASQIGGAARVGTTVLRATTDYGMTRDKTLLLFLVAIPKGDAYQVMGTPRIVFNGKVVGGVPGNQGLHDAQKTTDRLRSLDKQCKGGT